MKKSRKGQNASNRQKQLKFIAFLYKSKIIFHPSLDLPVFSTLLYFILVSPIPGWPGKSWGGSFWLIQSLHYILKRVSYILNSIANMTIWIVVLVVCEWEILHRRYSRVPNTSAALLLNFENIFLPTLSYSELHYY